MGIWHFGQFGGQVTFVNLDDESDKLKQTVHSCFRARCIVPECQDGTICHSQIYQMQKMRSCDVVTSNYRSNLLGNLSVSQLIVSLKLQPLYKFFNIVLHHIRTQVLYVLMSEYPKGAHIFCSYFNLCIFSGAQSGSSHKASTTNFKIKTKFAGMGIFFKRSIFLYAWAFLKKKKRKDFSKLCREFSIRGELQPIVALFVNLAICPHLLSDFSFNYS